ncbi:hypothetical protein GLOIN_2v1764372 [Rhizophagus irregularis DAOM 181602=DAOM 197198]|uniref:DUF8211 domain-containing protein n=1 Tax=Rhizophagus irregularis (strain DAOM 181602 / DAOM 197198 / MUCL 43194) TaxID=747089 RepID=A0A2P4QSJ5_RHIID|nr:hypothetical protein GLOIN_2v1764372 [Rhizophagus irregularis DAOM 181602=DAOM 197198]POG80528.1 hypothetical protein GLOIN_2v1764372 [Rhizophagus irregularis DAOM 181602=DAOM 197198]|eukprot:XP_025187394.1 hypothetical protein GLOIN_2v1764372 [Rhizophagus irregularis DAOM 181602=DAOM 197198]
MSYNRRACVSHRKNLDLFHNIKKPTPISKDTVNNKQFHATHTYNQWHNYNKKHIYSNRLGISYDVSYLANGYKYLHMYKDRRMYRKRLDNFCSHHSDSSKRSIKQKSRFQRACRSIFYNRGNNKKSHHSVDNLEDKLHRARQHRFLFLPSQHINKPIQHLKYHKRLVLRDEIYYNFPIPPESLGTRAANTWHDKLGIWIPNDLFPYVTDEPVYISKRQAKLKGQQYAPGSMDWLKGIRKRKEAHELAMRQQNDRDASEAARLLYEEELSTRAKLWGTSSNSIEYREEMTKDLTNFQEHFHKKITTLTDRRTVLQNRIKQGKSVYKSNKQLLQLEQELGLFKIDYFSVMDDNAYHYRYKGHTSDDTKKLEFRPHKRPPTSSTNTDRHVTHIKKLRSDTLPTEDFKVFTSP